MASVQEIRELVSSYVVGDIPASDLANRFTPVLKAALNSRDNSAREVAISVHAQIAHYFNGLISEDDFRANLQPVADLVLQGVASASYQVVRSVESEFLPFNPDPRTATIPDIHLITA